MIKYKCLVLDHDDTVVKSTPEIHYPSFKRVLDKIRPEINMTLEDFYMYCFEPGFNALCHDILKFTDEEMQFQIDSWKEFVSKNIPKYYKGFENIIKKQKEEGGLICVVSHSCSENIERDYKVNFGIVPDMIFGWELGEGQRKPNPYPLEEIMRTYNLKPCDLLMIDDLKPGHDMAKGCNVKFAYAGWALNNEVVAAFMKENSNYYFNTVKELEEFLYVI